MESFARSFRESTKKLEYGIRLNEEVKAVGIKRFVNLVKSDTLFSSHGESIEEYLNFGRQKNGTFKANYGNDDLVMSDVDLSYWLMADDSNSNGYLKDVESFLRDINDKPENVVMIYDSDQTTREKIYFNSNEYRVRDHEKALSLSNNSKPDIYQDSDYFDDNGSHTINPLMSSVFI